MNEDRLLTEKEIDNLTPIEEEIQAFLKEPNETDVLLPRRIKRQVAIVVVHCRKVAKAQDAKTYKALLSQDTKELEGEIRKILRPFVKSFKIEFIESKPEIFYDATEEVKSLEKLDNFIKLHTAQEKEKAVREERERIEKWGNEYCEEHISKIAGFRIHPRLRRECPTCWQALQEKVKHELV